MQGGDALGFGLCLGFGPQARFGLGFCPLFRVLECFFHDAHLGFNGGTCARFSLGAGKCLGFCFGTGFGFRPCTGFSLRLGCCIDARPVFRIGACLRLGFSLFLNLHGGAHARLCFGFGFGVCCRCRFLLCFGASVGGGPRGFFRPYFGRRFLACEILGRGMGERLGLLPRFRFGSGTSRFFGARTRKGFGSGAFSGFLVELCNFGGRREIQIPLFIVIICSGRGKHGQIAIGEQLVDAVLQFFVPQSGFAQQRRERRLAIHGKEDQAEIPRQPNGLALDLKDAFGGFGVNRIR